MPRRDKPDHETASDEHLMRQLASLDPPTLSPIGGSSGVVWRHGLSNAKPPSRNPRDPGHAGGHGCCRSTSSTPWNLWL